MALPIHYNLGFFEIDLIAGEFGDRIENLRLADGADTERFDRVVEELFGELPTLPYGSSSSVYRDDCGRFTVSLWSIDKQTELADAVLELQEQTGCGIFRLVKGMPGYANRQSLVADLRYYVNEYQDTRRAECPPPFLFGKDKIRHSSSTRETGHRRRNSNK